MSYKDASGYKFHRPRIEEWREPGDDVDFVVTPANHVNGTHIYLSYLGQPRVRVAYTLPKTRGER